MAETLRGYDAWLTTEPEPWSYGRCDICGDDMYEENCIYECSSDIGHADCLVRQVAPCHDCRKARCVCP